jgi:hypothetical protein
MSTLDEGDDEYGYGRATNVKIQAAFSAAAQARRSQKPTQAKQTSSWDNSSESEDSEDSEDSELGVQVAGTIHQGETPWFNVDENGVVRATAVNETMDESEEEESEWDLDCPLLIRPFMFKLLDRLRQRLDI